MRINNKSIKGIFVYSPNKEFEVGDLVIYDQMIYSVVKVKGDIDDLKTPDTSDRFVPYYRKDIAIATKSDLENFNSSDEDKLVTLNLLKAAINTRLLGYNDRGTISSVSDPNGPVSTGVRNISDLISSLGNCCLLVDRNFGGLPSSIDVNAKGDLLLRVYKTSSLNKLIELVDFHSGVIYLSSVTLSGDESSKKFDQSNWFVSTSTVTSVELVNQILATYDGKIKILNDLSKNLKDNFRFKSVNIERGKSSVALRNFKRDEEVDPFGFIDVDQIEKLGEVTVRFSRHIENNLIKSYELGFDVSDISQWTGGGYTKNFWLDKDLAISVVVNSKDKWSIDIKKAKLLGIDEHEDDSDLKIESVYYREYYRYE